MSKELTELPTTDIVGIDQDKLTKFIEEGMPGIGVVGEAEIAKMFDMYLAGKTYNDISGIMRTPKPVVLYLSHRLNWFSVRQEYIVNLETNIRQRIIESKLMSQDFLLKMIQMWHKKIGAKMSRYMSSDDEEFTDQINLKELDRYLKTLDMLQKSIAIPGSESRPLVGINVGEGATMTRTGDNTIEITPKENAKTDMLKYYADMAREKDKEKK